MSLYDEVIDMAEKLAVATRDLEMANLKAQTRTLSDDEVIWVVNDLGELGVKIGNQCFFLYKGESLEYKGTPDEGSPRKYRLVGKREFGETCKPTFWAWKAGEKPVYGPEWMDL
jgi:hypothetical protein